MTRLAVKSLLLWEIWKAKAILSERHWEVFSRCEKWRESSTRFATGGDKFIWHWFFFLIYLISGGLWWQIFKERSTSRVESLEMFYLAFPLSRSLQGAAFWHEDWWKRLPDCSLLFAVLQIKRNDFANQLLICECCVPLQPALATNQPWTCGGNARRCLIDVHACWMKESNSAALLCRRQMFLMLPLLTAPPPPEEMELF